MSIGHFEYGRAEIEYLSARDPKLGAAIARLGHVTRETDRDLFAALMQQFIGQQISMKAMRTIWQRLQQELGTVTPLTVASAEPDLLHAQGIALRKVNFMQQCARRSLSGELKLDALAQMDDDAVVAELTQLNGVGVWTAQMLLLFSLQRKDVVSFSDLAIQRGMRMLYRHRVITPKLFAKYRRRYHPYGSVASLYLWEIAGGALPELTDPASSRKVRCPKVRRIKTSTTSNKV